MPVTEKRMWAKMRGHLNTIGMATRIENVAASSIPDVMFFWNAKFAIIELKVLSTKTEVRFNKYQMAWWHEYFRQTDGVNGMIVVSDKRDLVMTAYEAEMLVAHKPRVMANGNVMVKVDDDYRIGLVNSEAQWREALNYHA